MSGSEVRFQRWVLNMSGPQHRSCPILWHPNGQIPFRGYKRLPCPSSVGHSVQLNTLWTNLSWAQNLSLKLHSNPSFIREIWAFLLSDPLNVQASTSSMIYVCSFLLGTHPLDILGVVLESSRLWWTSKSLYCPLLCGDLLVENRTRSLWSFREVSDQERFGSLWALQWRCRLPLWLAELEEQMLCLLCMLVLIYLLFLLKFILA
jgi:hypothetical protein